MVKASPDSFGRCWNSFIASHTHCSAAVVILVPNPSNWWTSVLSLSKFLNLNFRLSTLPYSIDIYDMIGVFHVSDLTSMNDKMCVFLIHKQN